MNKARHNILSRLSGEPPIEDIPLPKIATSLNQNALIQTFEIRLKENAAKVIFTLQQDISDCINTLLTSNQLGNTVITNLKLGSKIDGLNVINGRATGEETVGLSEALCGISDTGTLVLTASQENPTSINYLVDHHIVIIKQEAIVSNLYDAMTILKEKKRFQSRAINFISGPSRTADIEQTIQLGAHGPRNLWVIVTN